MVKVVITANPAYWEIAKQIILSLITLCTQTKYFRDVVVIVPVYSDTVLIHIHYLYDDKLTHANKAYISCGHQSDL